MCKVYYIPTFRGWKLQNKNHLIILWIILIYRIISKTWMANINLTSKLYVFYFWYCSYKIKIMSFYYFSYLPLGLSRIKTYFYFLKLIFCFYNFTRVWNDLLVKGIIRCSLIFSCIICTYIELFVLFCVFV